MKIQQSAFGAWPTHLHAARTIVADRGGFRKLLLDEGALMGEALTTYMLYVHHTKCHTPVNIMLTNVQHGHPQCYIHPWNDATSS